jgi:nucleoside-diphosphate-sugar epimerase
MDDLYNLSKLTGESLALASGRPTRIARIANVYDPSDLSDNFLSSVIRSAVTTGVVTLDSAADSAKDYVRLDDVVFALSRIAIAGRGRIYNVCSGTNLSHAELATRLAAIVPCQVRYAAGATAVTFPLISNRRLLAEFSFRPASLLDDLPALVAAYRGCGELSAC